MTFFNQPLALVEAASFVFCAEKLWPEMHLILLGKAKDGNDAVL
jgi:hypothetical protein